MLHTHAIKLEKLRRTGNISLQERFDRTFFIALAVIMHNPNITLINRSPTWIRRSNAIREYKDSMGVHKAHPYYPTTPSVKECRTGLVH